MPHLLDPSLERGGLEAECGRSPVQDLLLADPDEGQSEVLARPRQRRPEMLAVGRVDKRVRGEDRAERRKRAARGHEETAGTRLPPLYRELVKDFPERLPREPHGSALAPIEKSRGLLDRKAFGFVVRLLRARNCRVCDLDPPPHRDLDCARPHRDRDERRPSRVRAQADRGGLSSAHQSAGLSIEPVTAKKIASAAQSPRLAGTDTKARRNAEK